MLVFRSAQVLHGTPVAEGLPSLACLPAMEDGCVGEPNPPVLWDQLHQVSLDFFGIGILAEIQPAGDSRDVCIDDDTRSDIERYAENHVGSLTRDTGKLDQFLHRSRHPTAEFLYDHSTGGSNVLCLIAKKTCRADILFQDLRRSPGKILGSAILVEQIPGNQVNPLVGTLSR